MPELQDFIQSAMKSLGTTEQATRSATGGVLQLIKQYAGQGDFKEILDKVPGTDALLKEAPSAALEAKAAAWPLTVRTEPSNSPLNGWVSLSM